MSMSQEEIEALMNGLEVTDEEDTSTDDSPVSDEDIANLMAETDSTDTFTEDPVNSVADSIDETITAVEENEENFDDILAGIDGVVDNEPSKVEAPKADVKEKETPSNQEKEKIGQDWTNAQIEQGVFPLPVDKNHKVVNQLTQVASDSEEKASKIFDVLTFILDENNEVQKSAKELEEFINKQIILLDSLSKKFPNIEVFKANLAYAHSIKEKPKDIVSRVDNENMQLFEAMELMQFHDINRQKIERVMSVIRKLSNYLNNLFEDDSDYKEVAVAKHIAGDNNSDLIGDDDLESLIAEFGN